MAIRVVVVADSHFDEGSRFAECVRLHQEIEGWVRANKPDLLVHAGDIFERRSTPTERHAVADWLQDIAQTCPVVVVRGNHDAEADVEFMDRLRSVHPIRCMERPGVVQAGCCQIACLPWPRKAALLASLGHVPQEHAAQAAQEALRAVLGGFPAMMRDTTPCLFVGHVMMRGSVTSVGNPLVGMDMELGLDDLALARCDAYALGHIHKGQGWEVTGLHEPSRCSTWTPGNTPAFYPGSPRRTAFGELESKGFSVISFMRDATNWKAEVEFVELPATPMVLIETEWAPEHVGMPGDVIVPAGFADFDQSNVAGAEVRFRYNVASEHREAARAAAQAWRELALSSGQVVSVKVEEVVEAAQRARAPEVATARTLQEQLDAYWASKGFDPGSRRSALLSKLSELEVSHEA